MRHVLFSLALLAYPRAFRRRFADEMRDEFDRSNRAAVSNDLEKGRQLLDQAGFPRTETFVAPHDKFSRVSYREVAKRFAVISTGWFESRRGVVV